MADKFFQIGGAYGVLRLVAALVTGRCGAGRKKREKRRQAAALHRNWLPAFSAFMVRIFFADARGV
jgi:hypothetical protein